MENYIVSARKYRPSTFESVIGQHALTTTLKNAISTGKLAHAYLFCGPRGVGKTTCARIFAKTINCMSPTAQGEACNECESCRAFNEQRSYNIHELDAASNNSVDDIRQLVEQVRIPPQIGKYKVYIIDEVHMLSTSAFNAFLKTLEEPPKHAIFILATTEKHKILPTILSRCQIYDFNRIGVEDIVAHLAYVASKEGISAEPEALNVIALKADGGMRDALSIFDQVVSFTGGHITYRSVIENLNVLDYEYYFSLTDYLLANKVSESLLLLNDVLNKGFDCGHFINGLSLHLRDLLVSKDPVTLPLLEVGASIRERYRTQAEKCPLSFLYQAMKLCNDCDLNYRASKNKRLLVELTLIQIAQLTDRGNDTPTEHTPKPSTSIKPVFTQPAQQGAQTTTPQQPAYIQQPAPSPLPNTAPNKPSAATAQPVSGRQPAQAAVATDSAFHPQTSIAQTLKAQEKDDKKIPSIKKRGLSVSIKHPQPEESTQPTEPLQVNASPTHAQSEDEDYMVNEKDVNHYWLEYAGQMPQEQIALAKRMQNMHIIQLNDTAFETTVENEIIAKEFSGLIPDVQKYLREKLKNRKITIAVRISASEEKKRVYGKAEKFQMMNQKNSALMDLKEKFGLELY